MFDLIEKVKSENPLVLHYTNEVSINDCANVTLAIGGSPLMSYNYDEVEELVKIADSVVINIGTMNSEKLDLFLKAGKMANKYNVPLVLDPVGVCASSIRKKFVEQLIKEIKFDVIKANASEIGAIVGFEIKSKGVDSISDNYDLCDIIKKASQKLNSIIVITGKVDYISDGKELIKIYNGTEKLKNITGTGCMIGSLIGSFLGVYKKNIKSVAMGVLSMSLSGELANLNNLPIGSFKVELFNNIYALDKEKFEKYGRIKKYEL